MTDDIFEGEEGGVITLTDETGHESDFEIIATREIDGVTYVALYPLEDNEAGEYVLLKIEDDENGEEMLVTIDDDDEYDKIADIFEDEVFSDIDYDEE
ncbi:MAG: DUF1292 domain-containing protein [Clostridia bacterium]|nr:DUF1292 domain-containing protein [Clostridia bacterium]